MIDTYILDSNNNPIPEPDAIKWSEFMQGQRTLCRNWIGKVLVSTVFLGIDHAFGYSVPVLWETMIFDSDDEELKEYQERYTSQKDAIAGHDKAVELVESKIVLEQAFNNFMEGKTSNHSRLGIILVSLLNRIEKENIAYKLEAIPAYGYVLSRINQK